MRISILALTALLGASCKPSATVERTMPVANLQSYRSVSLRVHANTSTQGQESRLEQQTLDGLRKLCGFEAVGPASGQPVDVQLDLNITGTGRGGTGFMKNENLATLDTLLVLTDGETKELLGTARIHGESSGMVVDTGGGSSPEQEAADIVAKTVVELLAKSGCSGPRVAKAPPPPPTTPPPPGTGSGEQAGSGSAATTTSGQVSDEQRAQAEALNDQGKEKLQTADLTGALANFQGAAALAPDPRFQFNICLVLEAQQQWDGALAACQKAKTMNPDARLAAKIDSRIELVKNHQ